MKSTTENSNLNSRKKFDKKSISWKWYKMVLYRERDVLIIFLYSHYILKVNIFFRICIINFDFFEIFENFCQKPAIKFGTRELIFRWKRENRNRRIPGWTGKNGTARKNRPHFPAPVEPSVVKKSIFWRNFSQIDDLDQKCKKYFEICQTLACV